MYHDLRHNIISTVYNSWRSTGFAWEQYNPETGAGQRTQGFTGWTALLVNILALPDLVDATSSGSGPLPRLQQAMSAVSLPLVLFISLVGVGIVFRRRIWDWWSRKVEGSPSTGSVKYSQVAS
jgi:hypothetical protein